MPRSRSLRCSLGLGLGVAVALCALASAALAHPQMPRDYLLAPAPTVVLRDTSMRAVASGYLRGSIVIVGPEASQQDLAWVCIAGMRCARVLRLGPCIETLDSLRMYVPPVARCAPGWLRVEHEPLRALPPPPPPPPPPEDHCRALRPRAWVHGGSSGAGVEFAWYDGVPRLGATFAPGYRRFVPHYQRGDLESAPGCDDPSPRDVYGGALFGSEIGFDVRGRLLWQLGGPGEDLSSSLGFVPVGRVLVARGRVRLPSVLGAILPEIGYTMRSRKFDDAGVRLERSRTEWSLYLRPAGWTFGVVLAREPLLTLDFNFAPWFAVPLSAQPAGVGASGYVSVSAIGW